jgi:hypothetical protein
MDHEMVKLLKRLAFLGYCSIQIKNIVEDVIGNDDFNALALGKRNEVIKQLENYERLGLSYLEAYSK